MKRAQITQPKVNIRLAGLIMTREYDDFTSTLFAIFEKFQNGKFCLLSPKKMVKYLAETGPLFRLPKSREFSTRFEWKISQELEAHKKPEESGW